MMTTPPLKIQPDQLSDNDYKIWENQIRCSKCSEDYLNWSDALHDGISDYEDHEQKVICEDKIGDHQYCIFDDTWFTGTNVCKPNTAIDGCN